MRLAGAAEGRLVAAAGQGLAGAVGAVGLGAREEPLRRGAPWAGGPRCVAWRCRRVPGEVLLTSHASEHLPRRTVTQPSHHGAVLCQVTRWVPARCHLLLPSTLCAARGVLPGSEPHTRCCPPCREMGRRLRWAWGSTENPSAHVPAIQIGAVRAIPAAHCRQR